MKLSGAQDSGTLTIGMPAAIASPTQRREAHAPRRVALHGVIRHVAQVPMGHTANAGRQTVDPIAGGNRLAGDGSSTPQ